MLLCTICHFEAPLDDVVVQTAGGGCICLRCYGRETGSERRMPKRLRRELISALAELEAA